MKPTAQTRSYIGESVYVGIDVHKRTYSVVARVNQTEAKRWTTAAEPEKLGQQLRKFFPEAEFIAPMKQDFRALNYTENGSDRGSKASWFMRQPLRLQQTTG